MLKSSFVYAAAVMSVSAILTQPALADQVVKNGATDIFVNSSSTPVITVRNVGGKNIANLKLAAQENSITVGVGGGVDCKGIISETAFKREGYYLSGGAFGIGSNALAIKQNLPSSTNINYTSDIDFKSFDVTLATLKSQGLVNAAAKVKQTADSAPSGIEYLRHDHVIFVNIPVRFEASCMNYSRNKVTKNTIIEANQPLSYAIKNVQLRINYIGDPDLFQLNAQLNNNNNGGNQVNAGPQNFITVTGGTFLQGEVHKKNKCPMDANFKLKLTGTGSGQVKIHITDGGVTVHNSPSLAFTQGSVVHDFSQKLLYIGSDLNKKKDHKYRVYVKVKKNTDNFFPSNYQSLPIALNWSHTCIKPVVVNPKLGTQGSGGLKYNNAPAASQTQTPKLKIAPQTPKLKLKRAPVTPPVDPVAPRRATTD